MERYEDSFVYDLYNTYSCIRRWLVSEVNESERTSPLSPKVACRLSESQCYWFNSQRLVLAVAIQKELIKVSFLASSELHIKYKNGVKKN